MPKGGGREGGREAVNQISWMEIKAVFERGENLKTLYHAWTMLPFMYISAWGDVFPGKKSLEKLKVKSGVTCSAL